MMGRNSQLAWAAGAALALAMPALAQPAAMKAPAAMKVPAADKHFIIKAAQGGAGEVALGKLAVSRGSSPGVKQFGQRMIQDHTKANAELMQVAAQQGVTPPSSPGPEEQATQARLSRLSGAAFDKAYAADMVEDHVKDIADFKKEARGGKDPAVKAFAAKTLPTLEMHLQMARSLKSGK